MKASLLARPARVLLFAIALTGGAGMAGSAALAATIANQSGATAPAQPDTTAAPTNAPAAQTNATATTNGPSAGSTATEPSTEAGATAMPQQTLEQMADQRITDLHSRLQITSKQQAKWDRFANVMRANARELDQAYRQRAQGIDTMNAEQNMKSYVKIEQTRARDIAKLVPAFDSLYATLTPQQKQAADTLFRARAQQAQNHRQNAAAAHR